MRKNPFQYLKPVQYPKDFFGRKEEIKSMYRQILSSHSVSLIGERKIGKTSLLLHLAHSQTLAEHKISPEDTLMFYIDISSCSLSKSSDVFRRFLECISEKVSGKIREDTNILLEEEYIHFRQFEDIIARINNSNQKIVFLLDEFESISMIRQGDIFSRLRYLAQMYDVVFVISTLRDLMSLFQEDRFSTSPFFNIFTKYQLKGLDENACYKLIATNFERENLKIDPSVINPIIRFSGTNPCFLKLTCFFYFEKFIDGQSAFDDNVKALVQQGLEPHHKYNWDHLPGNEQAALLDIIKNGDTKDLFAERSLERKGYIAKRKDESYITSESFYDYLKDIYDSRSSSLDSLETQIAEVDIQHNLTKNDRNALKEAKSAIESQQLHSKNLNAPIFSLIGYLELEMREYIKNTLEMALGKIWFNDALDDISKKEIEKRILKEKKRRMDFKVSENLLNYALLENLKDIILRRENWDLCFSQYFKDKKFFEVKMQEIIDVRNRIAHYHPIHFNEAVTVIQNILWILTHMRS